MKKVAIVIRGHERNTTSNKNFSVLIHELSQLYDVDIFIHTWNLSEAEISWRPLPRERVKITEEKILKYFDKTSDKIKKIFVEDDEEIELIGRTVGRLYQLEEIKIGGPWSESFLSEVVRKHIGPWSEGRDLSLRPGSPSSPNKKVFFLECGCPILSWKKMWHGIYTAANEVYKQDTKYDAVLNTRFDILNTYATDRMEPINLEFVANLIDSFDSKNKIMFAIDRNSIFIDNIYVGTKRSMYTLCKNFHFYLDEIVKKYNISDWEAIQEKLVFLEAQKYFSEDSKTEKNWFF